MATLKHIHKLKRHTYRTGEKTYFCVEDDCTFKIGVEFVVGKSTICWRCGNPFKMNAYSIRLAKPHCENCHNSKTDMKELLGIKDESYDGPDRRVNPTRRELDPTVLPQVAADTINTLKAKVSGEEIVKYKTIDPEDEDLEL